MTGEQMAAEYQCCLDAWREAIEFRLAAENELTHAEARMQTLGEMKAAWEKLLNCQFPGLVQRVNRSNDAQELGPTLANLSKENCWVEPVGELPVDEGGEPDKWIV